MKRDAVTSRRRVEAIATVVVSLVATASLVADDAPLPRRWLELEVPAADESPLVPIATEELATLLATHGYAGVLLDFPSGTGAFDESWALPFRTAGLAVRSTRRATQRIDELPPWPAIEPRLLPGEGDGDDPAAVWLRPLLRPAVIDWLWQAPPEATGGGDGYLSSRLLLPTRPERRAEQMRLDLASFAPVPAAPSPPIDAPLLRQSALASELAALLGGNHPELIAPLENRASNALDALRWRPLRRAPEWLEVDEWFGAFGSDGEMLAARLLRDPAPPAALAAALSAARDTRTESGQSSRAGIVDDATRTWLADAIEQRWQATAKLAALLRDPTLRLAEDAVAAAPPATITAPAWRDGIEYESRQRVAERWQLHPWRVHTRRFALSSKTLRAGVSAPPLDVLAIDDPRLERFVPQLAAALKTTPWDLAAWLPVVPGATITLRTTLALRDPRQFRLELDAAATCTVRLNEALVIDRFSADRDHLLTTLAVPAGTSELSLELVLDGTRDTLQLALELLPQRAGGLLLSAANASQVVEPMVRLGDAGALDGASLALLAARPQGGEGNAFFPFALDTTTLYDVWLHALPIAGGGALELDCDGSPPLKVDLAPASGWRWQRVAAPFWLTNGSHALRLRLLTAGVRLDQIALVASETRFPRLPAGDQPLWNSAWRYDPLGSGIVVDLPTLTTGELFGRAFEVEKSGNYQLYAWLKGSSPMAPGQRAEVELTSPSTRVRLVLPAGTPSEEWVALGDVALTAGERVELRVRGDGALARVALRR